MVFSSTIFLFAFLPITLFGYYIIRHELRNFWLLIVSLVFFAWSQPNYLWIILVSILINHVGAFLVNVKNHTIKKLSIIMIILINLGFLFYYKYFNFTIDTISKLFNFDIIINEVILPIGISFFTFQGMSYVIDVYKNKVSVQKNILNTALYITLFPQLIAGPIVRYIDVEKEINNRNTTLEDFSEGIKRFIIGLFKKTVIANTMASAADSIWNAGTAQNTVAIAWIGIITYSLQIFFDFSGYSDMAIGLGKMFGFRFNENFNYPYISKSIGEFWRRWHISLSTWFRDYVYIPLGGNRKRVYLNVAIIFLLTGIWHGAAWNYIFWGIWHGFFAIIERLLKSMKLKPILPKVVSDILKHFYTLSVVLVGWIFFRAEGIKHGVTYLKSMFGLAETSEYMRYTAGWYLDRYTLVIMILGFILCTPVLKKLWEILKGKLNTNMIQVIRNTILITMFMLSILRVVSNTYNPFIYFQF